MHDDPYSSGEEAYNQAAINEGRGFFPGEEGDFIDTTEGWNKIGRKSKMAKSR